jgi:hypothetical protein
VNALVRFSICVSVVAATVCGLGFLQPQSFKQLRREVTRLPDLPAVLKPSRPPEDTTKTNLTRVLARVEVKRILVAELIARRLTLAEAADRLRELDEAIPLPTGEILRALYPNCCQAEVYCRSLINLVESELVERPALSEATVARLEVELQALRESGRFGTKSG